MIFFISSPCPLHQERVDFFVIMLGYAWLIQPTSTFSSMGGLILRCFNIVHSESISELVRVFFVP